jgi:hypothetical protein
VVKTNDARDNSEMDSIPCFQSEAGLEVKIIEKLKENIFQVKPTMIGLVVLSFTGCFPSTDAFCKLCYKQ